MKCEMVNLKSEIGKGLYLKNKSWEGFGNGKSGDV
jgi:hypothetical protein